MHISNINYFPWHKGKTILASFIIVQWSELFIFCLQKKNDKDFCPSNKWNKDKAFGNDEKKADGFEDDVFKYAQNNIVTLTMFIREPFAEKIVTNEKISRISFMSDVGGLLGLFMGFSFVSAVEIIYHAFKVSMLGSLRPQIIISSYTTPSPSLDSE